MKDLQNPLRLQHYKGKLYILESTKTGNIKVINPTTEATRNITCNLPTYQPFEYGLIGMALDPNYDRNGWIYLQYFTKAKREQGS